MVSGAMPPHRVEPVCVAPEATHPDIFAPFYSLGCVTAYAKVHEPGGPAARLPPPA